MKTISTSRLLIYDVQPSDYGKYECLASTDLGNATATLNYTGDYIKRKLASVLG